MEMLPGGALAIVAEPMIDHVCYLWWPNALVGHVVSGEPVNVPLIIPFALPSSSDWVVISATCP